MRELVAGPSPPTRRGACWTALVAMLAAAGGHLASAPQDPASAQEPLPTFRAGIEAVQMDVFVTDASGQPVTGLTVDDFEVLEAGVPVAITTFSAVDLPVAPPAGPAASWVVAPDVQGNGGPEGRLYVFALDEVEAPNALRTRAFLRRFLEEHFQADDVGAVVLTGRGLADTGQDFTSNRRLLLEALDRFSGGFGTSCAAVDAAARSGGFATDTIPLPRNERDDFAVRARMASLRDLIEVMARMPGGRKSIVYVSECIGYDMFDIVDYRGGTLSLVGSDAQAAMAAATRGNVAVYPIDPGGLCAEAGCLGNVDMQEARADFVAIAQVTGGFALSNSNNYAEAFARIVQENSTYYVLGFNSAYTERNGRFVRVQVRVRRPGLQVRARDGYVAPLGRAPDASTAAGADAARTPLAVSAMANPFATRGVGMRVFAAPYKGTGRDPAVALALEIDVSTLEFVDEGDRIAGELDLTYVATDARGRVYPGGRHQYLLTLTPGQHAQLTARGGLRVVSQLSLPSGRYQLRVGAGQSTRSGSVVYDLEIPEFGRGPLVLSGLSITSDHAEGTLTVRPAPATAATSSRGTRCDPPSCRITLVTGAPSDDDPLRAMPGAPATLREFERSDTLVLYAEAYENGRRGPDDIVTFEVLLQAEDGTVWPLHAETRAATAERRPSGGHALLAELSLRDVPPGRYLLQLVARSSAGRGATAAREVPVGVR
jgi:VWFA-related protein